MMFHGRKHLKLTSAGRVQDYSTDQIAQIVRESTAKREEFIQKDAESVANGEKYLQKRRAKKRKQEQ